MADDVLQVDVKNEKIYWPFLLPKYVAEDGKKLWVAIVSADTKAPGGMARKFLKKISSDYRYASRFIFFVDEVKPGDYLEFGGIDASNKQGHSVRKYFRVEKKESDCLHLAKVDRVDVPAEGRKI